MKGLFRIGEKPKQSIFTTFSQRKIVMPKQNGKRFVPELDYILGVSKYTATDKRSSWKGLPIVVGMFQRIEHVDQAIKRLSAY